MELIFWPRLSHEKMNRLLASFNDLLLVHDMLRYYRIKMIEICNTLVQGANKKSVVLMNYRKVTTTLKEIYKQNQVLLIAPILAVYAKISFEYMLVISKPKRRHNKNERQK
jgi:hypothetical protein